MAAIDREPTDRVQAEAWGHMIWRSNPISAGRLSIGVPNDDAAD